MKQRTPKWFTCVFLVIASIARSYCVCAQDELSRGKRWVRSHPFCTMALTIIPESFDPHEYRDANLSTVLAWKQRTGLLEESASVRLPWHLNVQSSVLRKAGLTNEIKARLKSHHDNYAGCTGWVVWDEPKRPEMFIEVP